MDPITHFLKESKELSDWYKSKIKTLQDLVNDLRKLEQKKIVSAAAMVLQEGLEFSLFCENNLMDLTTKVRELEEDLDIANEVDESSLLSNRMFNDSSRLENLFSILYKTALGQQDDELLNSKENMKELRRQIIRDRKIILFMAEWYKMLLVGEPTREAYMTALKIRDYLDKQDTDFSDVIENMGDK